jgi:hypothetical protein
MVDQRLCMIEQSSRAGGGRWCSSGRQVGGGGRCAGIYTPEVWSFSPAKGEDCSYSYTA